MDQLKFGDDFLWGAATSAPQTEGAYNVDGRSLSTWDKWFELEPERFDEGVGPHTTSNVYYQYKDDIELMKQTNLNSFRTSIAWTRLLPDGISINEKAVAYYRDYFSSLKEAGILPIVNLFHFDMPWWQMEKGGWLNYEITDRFAFYAQTAVELFGDIVSHWVTFNEPIVHVECSYLYGYHYPAEVDFKEAILAGYHTILAHAKAIEVMRNVNPNLKYGTILNLTPVYARSDDEKDMKAREIADLLIVRSFLDGMVKGEFDSRLVTLLNENDLNVSVKKTDLKIIEKVHLDFLGVNYYQPIRVKAPEKAKTPAKMPSDFFKTYIWPERRVNKYRGWEIYPEALYDIGMLIKNDYDNIPWFVSENGMGVADEMRFVNDQGIVQDDYRIEFIKEHLYQMKRAIDAGSNLKGYHLWTFVDCWSWLNGYRNRYGLYRLDLETQKRYPKKSSFWLRDFIESQKEDV